MERISTLSNKIEVHGLEMLIWKFVYVERAGRYV